jgi:gliding motility-associated-like protein
VTSQEVTSDPIAVQTSDPVTPTITISVSPNTTICDGDNVTFSIDAQSNEGSTPSYVWVVNGTELSETNDTYATTSIVNNDKVEVKMTSSLGCVTQSDVVSNAIDMVVTDQVDPDVTIAIVGGVTNVCNGEQVDINVTGSSATSASSVFTWKVNGTAEGTTEQDFSSTTLKTGDLVTVETSNLTTCATQPTAESTPVSITVISPFTPNLSISEIKNDVCAGEAIEFSLTPLEVGSSPTYDWLVNGIPTGINKTSLKNTDVSLTNGDVVEAQVTVLETCVTGSQVAKSNSFVVKTSPLLTPTISMNVSSTEVCDNEPVIVSISSQKNEGISPSYVWKIDGVVASTSSTSTSLILSGAETKNITVELTSSEKCVVGNQPTVSSFPVSVIVNPIINPSVNIVPLVDAVCETASSYGLSAVNSDINASYKWYINGVLSSETSSQLNVQNPANGDYIEVISETSSCVNPSNPTASDNHSLVVIPLSAPTLLVEDDRVCEGEDVIMKAFYNLDLVNPTIVWKKDGSILPFTGTELILDEISKEEEGTYEVFIRDQDKFCAEDDDKFKITVLERPTIVIGGNDGKTILEEESATFEVSVINGTDYQWESIGGDVLSSESSYTVSPTVSSTYNVVAWNEETTCNNTSSASVIVVEQVKVSNVFTPNEDGVHDTWIIESIEDYPDARVQIFTRWGQKVYETYSNYADRPWDGKYEGTYSPVGVYYYIIELNSEIPILNEPIKGEVHILK